MLPTGDTLAGRSTDCELVLDSPLVSRRHARIAVSSAGVVVQDLASRNGVVVNGTLVQGLTAVYPGDRIQLGDQHLELGQVDTAQGETRITDAGGSDRTRASQVATSRAARDKSEPAQPERTTQPFAALGGTVDQALALGRADEAAQLLSADLQRVLSDAEQHHELQREVREAAVRYAVKLGAATRKAGWVNYAIRVYQLLALPLPMDVVHELYRVLRKIRGVDGVLLRQYVAVLQSRVHQLGPAERVAVKRIAGLPTLTGL